jgi:hypothetical protein
LLVGLALDATAMTVALPAFFLLAGGFVGAIHFAMVAADARALVTGEGMLRTIVFRLGRVALSGGLLVVAARSGAPSLIAAAAGMLAARQWAIARFGRMS